MKPLTLRETIQVQAKRLRSLFKIDLTTAKNVLARGSYGCKDWEDLCAQLVQSPSTNSALQLAEFPHSICATAYLYKKLPSMASSISQLIITNRDLPALCEALRQVFAVEGNPVVPTDVLQAITPSEWLPTEIGPDPLAVIQSRISVNGVQLQLIGTRIFWPRLFTFDAEITVDPVKTEPLGDDLKIMWEVAPWLHATQDYLLEYQRRDEHEDLPDFLWPDIPECARMRQHARLFAQSLNGWSQECYYNDGDEEFIPFIYQGHAYLIFGVPDAEPVMHPPLDRQYIQFSSEDSNPSEVFAFAGQLLRIEKLIVPTQTRHQDWIYAEYHQTLCNGLLAGAEAANWLTPPRQGWGDLLIISPACRFTLNNQLQMKVRPESDLTLLTLQTDNPDLAIEIIERVHRGEFTLYEHALFGVRCTMHIELPNNQSSIGFILSMDCIEPKARHYARLITHCDANSDGDILRLSCNIAPALLNLVERQPLKHLKKAIREGVVLRGHGLLRQLVKLPKIRASASACNELALEEPIPDAGFKLNTQASYYQQSNS